MLFYCQWNNRILQNLIYQSVFKWEDSNQIVVFIDIDLIGTACCGVVIGYFIVKQLPSMCVL